MAPKTGANGAILRRCLETLESDQVPHPLLEPRSVGFNEGKLTEKSKWERHRKGTEKTTLFLVSDEGLSKSAESRYGLTK